MAKRMQHCHWCGEELGIYDAFGEIESCGKPECDRSQREAYREREEYIREQAERDNYDQYRYDHYR
ncbi:MAG: hypothetical protein Q7J27_00540 [Syntrophales bacterium]|nr:hypothetical protein [Syntrophales bacterium]